MTKRRWIAAAIDSSRKYRATLPFQRGYRPVRAADAA